MQEFLSLNDIAAKAGIEPATVRRYRFENRLPEPDAVIGISEDGRKHYGWLPETIDTWKRPGRGARTDLGR